MTYLDFLMGSVNQSAEFVSWKMAETQTYEELIQELFYSVEFDGEVKTDNERFQLIHRHLPKYFKAFNGFCRQLNQSSVVNNQALEIRISDNSDFQVFFADPSRSLHYMIHTESLKGDKIETWPNHHLYYSLEFEEVYWNKNSGECMNYGATGSDYTSFADCIESEQEGVLTPILGCMVPWLARPNSSNTCKGKVEISSANHTKFYQAIDKLYRTRSYRIVDQSKTCLKPCTEILATSVKKSFKFEQSYDSQTFQDVSLHFPRTVKVTRLCFN